MNLLASVVRHTAINGRHSITFDKLRVLSPLKKRREVLKEVISRFAIKTDPKADSEFTMINKLILTGSKM
jgi:hypothetical protein